MPPITNVDTLPGVSVDIADNQLRARRPAPGPKLTILGTTSSLALDVNDPVTITNLPSDLRRLRHTDDSPSELSLAVAEAFRVGATSVEVLKIATVSGEYDSLMSPNARFDALEDAYEMLKFHDVDHVVPVNAYADQTGLSGASPLGFTRAMGYKRQLSNFAWQATTEWNSCFGWIGVRPVNKVARNEAWAGAPTDNAEEYFDDPTIAHVREWVAHLRSEDGTLVDHTAETMLDGHLAGSEEESYGQISPDYDGWAQDEEGVTMVDQNGVNVDGGARIGITAILGRIGTAETQLLANLNERPAEIDQHLLSSGAVAVGAYVTTLAPEEALTGKAIPGVSASRIMSGSLAEKLTQARMITMLDRSGDFVISRGVTAAYNGGLYTRSDFVNVSTIRILDAAIDIIRDRAKRFIGRPNTPENAAAMEADIRSGLDGMKPSGALQRYRLFMQATPDAQVLGELSINFTAVIGHELVKVNVFTQLEKPDQIG